MGNKKRPGYSRHEFYIPAEMEQLLDAERGEMSLSQYVVKILLEYQARNADVPLVATQAQDPSVKA